MTTRPRAATAPLAHGHPHVELVHLLSFLQLCIAVDGPPEDPQALLLTQDTDLAGYCTCSIAPRESDGEAHLRRQRWGPRASNRSPRRRHASTSFGHFTVAAPPPIPLSSRTSPSPWHEGRATGRWGASSRRLLRYPSRGGSLPRWRRAEGSGRAWDGSMLVAWTGTRPRHMRRGTAWGVEEEPGASTERQ